MDAGRTGRLAIVAALPAEARAARGGRSLLPSDRTLSVVSGPGPAAARAAAEQLLEAEALQAVLSVGIAGGLRADLRCGDVIVSDRLLRTEGGAGFVGDAGLRQVAWQTLSRAGIHAEVGDSLTSPVVLASFAEKQAAAARGAAIVQMEDAEWAAVCAERGVAFCALRVVIDAVDEQVPSEPAAWASRPNPLVIAAALARRPGLARELARLRINLGRSIRALEQALTYVIPAVAEQTAADDARL